MFNTQASRDVYTLVKEGALDKCSFAFSIADGGDEYDRLTRTRKIKNIEKCYDCSVVDIPAYDSTSVQARSFFEMEMEKDNLDRLEREAKTKEAREKLLLRTYL